MQILKNILLFACLIVLCGAGTAHAQSLRYLAFQIFTASPDSDEISKNLPPATPDLQKTVASLGQQIGLNGSGDRRLGFILGPISFDQSDEKVRAQIADGFKIALATGTAVGFHIDDSMFWSRLKELNTKSDIEWLDWQGTPNTGRRLDWSETPARIMPQLCVNSVAVRAAVAQRASLVGDEVRKGVARLHAAGRDDLFIGVIAGWETQIGRDFDTGKNLGFCALTNAGYSAASPPADLDAARVKIAGDFIAYWASSLAGAGVPRGKIFSHIAFSSSSLYALSQVAEKGELTYPQTVNFTPPETAFCSECVPGFSTYPQPGHLEQWQSALRQHGNPPWASCEGTAMDPGQASTEDGRMDMERYLGNMFNHGAVLVTVFGWGVGEEGNPFRKVAENETALASYRKFLNGSTMAEMSIPVPNVPPPGLIDKIRKIQAFLPGWIETNGPAAVKDNVEILQQGLQNQKYDDVSRAADAILRTINKN